MNIVTPSNNSIFIPAPDLLDIVKRWLPGEEAISVMYSITGSLALRCARLAGIVANALAADERARTNNIDSYNDVMSYLSTLKAAQLAFEEAGSERLDLTISLRQLLSYKRTCDDYMVSIMGESKMRATNWADSLATAGEPMPVDQWKLDYLWTTYQVECNNSPLMTRAEYDVLNVRELSGQRAAWAKHIDTVLQFIDVADNGATIEFGQLDKRTQVSLLTSYATPERLAKFRASVMKRARSAFKFDAEYRLHSGFVEACRIALTHHRYADVSESIKAIKEPALPPAPSTVESRKIAQTTKARGDLGVHAEAINESVAAVNRQLARNIELAAKTAKSHKAKLVPELTLIDQPNDVPQ